MWSTQEIAEKLGVTRQRVFELIQEGSLPASKVGRAYIITEDNLREYFERQLNVLSRRALEINAMRDVVLPA